MTSRPMPPHRTLVLCRLARRAFALAGMWALGGCVLWGGPGATRHGSRPMMPDVRRVLDVDEPSPAYFRARARLEVLGPELDAILIGLVEDAEADENVRANAIALLAERRAGGSLDLIRRQLAGSPSDVVRAAAARALQRFLPDSAGARNALRAAAGDPSSLVRLMVLQRLDVEDAPLVRTMVARDDNAEVRTIARQVLELLEARGAPLTRDPRRDLRTSGPEGAPTIVFHPAWADSLGGVQVGALWVEARGSTSLVPLGQQVEVVGNVVPGFFDATRSVVVFEADREIRIRDLRTGNTLTLGPGVAPRVVPFTGGFVFVREVAGARRQLGGDATELDYEVLRASFSGAAPEVIGRITATARPEVRRGASPVRWMVVGEGADGFVLRGPGITPFALPGPVDSSPQP
ncbi:HEAT repeat domain-containing protein [Longimicrobium sp.]|uniref:HEAT repeat domain-containing protein n=1 Tax=Longimicrobium sp. TaxID=2029185 RepID=UPI002F9499F8